jgi:hypothetical protein
MPLKFRDTGLALSPTEIRKDCTAFSGGWEARERHGDCEAGDGDGDEPPSWFWSIHGGLGKPMDMAATAPLGRWKTQKAIWKRPGRGG